MRFEQCVVCRSVINYSEYEGNFEVTMLLNTLYMTIMYLFETRSVNHVKAKPIAKWLNDNSIVNKHGNEFDDDDVVRMFRNGLAHFNIEIPKGNGTIDEVIIFAKNMKVKAACSSECEAPKCYPKQFKKANGRICAYSFTIEKLNEFVCFVVSSYLEKRDKKICKQCQYKNHGYQPHPKQEEQALYAAS